MNAKCRSIAGQLIRCIRAPLRGLCSVRNYYVRGMTRFAACLPSSEAISCYRFASDEELIFGGAKLSSGEEDLRELISFASRKLEVGAGEAVRRNRSVAVGRIDEDGSCDFYGDVKVGESLIFPRSQTCAVGRKRPAVVVPV